MNAAVVPQFLTAAQLAEALNVDVTTVREWTRQRLIPHMRLPTLAAPKPGTDKGDTKQLGKARYSLDEVRAALTARAGSPAGRGRRQRDRLDATPAAEFDLPPAPSEAFDG